MNLVFVTTVYGIKYLAFLRPHLYTVSRCHPGASELVLWQDIPDSEIRLLASAFPHCVFLPVEEQIAGHPDQAIGRKLVAWKQACRLYPDNQLCFIDCDTLVVRSIDKFASSEVDVLFTWKDERQPVNTGVIIVNSGRGVTPFFEQWAGETERIVSDPNALAKALGASGSGDQHAFRRIVGFANYDGLFTRNVGGRDLTFKGVHCSLLNETNCVPITEETHMIHYKGGWHAILLEGRPFSTKRPEGECRCMYDYWQIAAEQTNRFVAREVLRASVSRYKEPIAAALNPSECDAVFCFGCVCREMGIQAAIHYTGEGTASASGLSSLFADEPVRLVCVAERRCGPGPDTVEGGTHEVIHGALDVAVRRIAGESSGGTLALFVNIDERLEMNGLLRLCGQMPDQIACLFLTGRELRGKERETLTEMFPVSCFLDAEELAAALGRSPRPDAACQRGPKKSLAIVFPSIIGSQRSQQADGELGRTTTCLRAVFSLARRGLARILRARRGACAGSFLDRSQLTESK